VNPLLKKAIAAVAITKGIDKIRDMRKPKRSRPRLSPILGLVGLGAGAFYLNKTGKLQPLIAKAKTMRGNGDDAVLEDSLRQPTTAGGE
jgi:hypothetical protein